VDGREQGDTEEVPGEETVPRVFWRPGFISQYQTFLTFSHSLASLPRNDFAYLRAHPPYEKNVEKSSKKEL
jgi:hypothetical protein